MNKHSVNISSLVLLLSLISLILEVCIYYFVPGHYFAVLFALFCSLGLSHFFLESSLNYDYNLLHSAFMTISSLIFGIVIYAIQPNIWIQYDFWIVLLILIQWLTPFLYCCIRDLLDFGPRFNEFHLFFKKMCILFLIVYVFAISKQYFITPIVPPYAALDFGAHDFVPFMATGSYIEECLRLGNTLSPLFIYLAEIFCFGIPYGYFIRIYCKKLPYILRLVIYLSLPALLELSQSLSGLGRCALDDYVTFLTGILIGTILYYATNLIFNSVASRDFLVNRTSRKNYYF